MRTASLLLGGIAGFMGLAWATFVGLVDALTSTGLPLALGAFALIGLVGASLARHRLRACVVLEAIAGVGLLAGDHIFLGILFIGATLLALVALGRSQPGERSDGVVRRDAAAAFSVVSLTGVAVLTGLALPVVIFLVVAAELSGH
jgi:hypothetical protein